MRLLLLLAVCMLACAETPLGVASQKPSVEAVVLYGVIVGIDGPVAGATVEVYCDCGWNKVTKSDSYGVYAFVSNSHIGHSGSMMAGAPGYHGTLTPYGPLGEFSNRMDLTLELE